MCMWRECKLSRAIDVVGAGVRLLAGGETRKGELELYEEDSRAITTPQGARKPLQDDNLGLTPTVEVIGCNHCSIEPESYRLQILSPARYVSVFR